MLDGPPVTTLTLRVVQRKTSPSSRSPRLALLESAFINWRLPGYLGSLAYRARRLSPFLFNAMMNTRIVLKTREGPWLVARLRDVNGPAEVFGLGEYERPWLDWTAVEYVVDAGAHVGGFSLWAASRSDCRIFALEPNPSTGGLLQANVRIAQLDGRVKVRKWALAAQKGSRRFHAAADSAASSLVADPALGEVEVETVTLEDVMAAGGFPRIDVVKMDIEGAEHEVFAAASAETLQKVRLWIVEIHPDRKSVV